MTQTSYYPVKDDYCGYSTPFALIDSKGKFHLFYDVVIYPEGGQWRQVALAHATSSDGNNFTETENDIIISGDENWTKTEVRSPSVIEEASIFKMWYAGHAKRLSSFGIGFANSEN